MQAPIAKLEESKEAETGKYVPIIFSHGIGNTMASFSTIVKDIASQGHIVFCLEHCDRTALHHYEEDSQEHRYFKNVDMRDSNQLKTNLGIRIKEID